MVDRPPTAPAPKRRGALLLVALALFVAAGGWFAWSSFAHDWRPDPARYPVQGVALGAANQPVSWAAMARQGARFAYVDLPGGSGAKRDYVQLVAAAHAAGLPVGTSYRFSLCPSWDQTAEFVTQVARNPADLPPLILLDRQESCDRWPSKAAVTSELTTFLNQIETHLGKAAIIATDSDFEAEYALRSTIERPVMIVRTRADPQPEDGEWALWQANDALAIDGAEGMVRWIVANEGVS